MADPGAAAYARAAGPIIRDVVSDHPVDLGIRNAIVCESHSRSRAWTCRPCRDLDGRESASDRLDDLPAPDESTRIVDGPAPGPTR